VLYRLCGDVRRSFQNWVTLQLDEQKWFLSDVARPELKWSGSRSQNDVILVNFIPSEVSPYASIFS
jgi:hypothetical protein